VRLTGGDQRTTVERRKQPRPGIAATIDSRQEKLFFMHGPVDKRLNDEALLAELEMTTNLMIAANQSDGPLSRVQVDSALGLTCPDAVSPSK
jgi:hypothetical protein